MSAYIIATVTIADSERFAEYGRAIKGLAERFGGEAVVKGAVEEVFEGEPSPGEPGRAIGGRGGNLVVGLLRGGAEHQGGKRKG